MKDDEKKIDIAELDEDNLSSVTGGEAVEENKLTVSDDILISKYSGTEVKDETMLIIPII
ncbi:MAG: hypothetical protein IKY41_00095 [Clostridia bacterium]|nr:hypothetical protein [Clostridia bacterium]